MKKCIVLGLIVLFFAGCPEPGKEDPKPNEPAAPEVPTVTITFKLDGGNIEGKTDDISFSATVGEVLNKPADPTKDGFAFNGWNPTVPEIVPETDKSFTAMWRELNKVSLTFDLAGGKIGESTDNVILTGFEGEAVGSVADPTKENFYFTGWDKAIPATFPATSDTITAMWRELNEVSLTFVLAGGKIGESTDNVILTGIEGEAVGSVADPTRENFYFTGWDKAIPATFPSTSDRITAQWITLIRGTATQVIAALSSTTETQECMIQVTGDVTGGSGGDVGQINSAAQNKLQSYSLDLSETTGLTSIVQSDDGFKGNTKIKEVMLPEGVITLGGSAFLGAVNLEKLFIPKSLKTLGSRCLERCSKLKFEVADGAAFKVENEGAWLLSADGTTLHHGAASEGEIEIPATVTTIIDSAFQDSVITSVRILNKNTIIQGSCFKGCSELTSVILPDQLVEIYNYTFYGCEKLLSINIPNSVTSIGSWAFCGAGITSITLPANLEKIREENFEPSLTSVEIPTNVETIGGKAFAPETKITVASGNTSFKMHESGNFLLTSDGTTLIHAHFENGTISGEIVTGEEIVVPEEVTTIGERVFQNVILKKVELPATITTLKDLAFWQGKINEFVCKATDVPSSGNLTRSLGFAHKPTLYVPSAQVEAYKTAWGSYFKEVKEITTE